MSSSGAGADPCDTDSFDSRDDSADRSKDTSPSASPRVVTQRVPSQMSTSVSEDAEPTPSAHQDRLANTKVTPSLATQTHRFKKVVTKPTKCRECDAYVYFEPWSCQDCGISCHRRCLEFLLLNCAHKRAGCCARSSSFFLTTRKSLKGSLSQSFAALIRECTRFIHTCLGCSGRSSSSRPGSDPTSRRRRCICCCLHRLDVKLETKMMLSIRT